MNVYEVRAKKDEEIYRIEMTEQTLEEATEHYNFWAEPDWKLGTDMEIIETGIDYSIDEYPYRAEDDMREILKNKEEFYGLLTNSKACEQDKQDLHGLVEQEKVWEFGHGLPRLAGLYMGKQKSAIKKNSRGVILPLVLSVFLFTKQRTESKITFNNKNQIRR